MKYFCILLKSDTKRVHHVEQNLVKHLPELEIVSAIEGSTNQLEFFLYDKTITDDYLATCRRAELACRLSHTNLWERMIRENLDEAVILEDDASISSTFLSDFEACYSELPSDYDFLYLFVHPYSRYLNVKIEPGANISEGFPTFGLVGYCITKKLVQQIIPFFQKIASPIDSILPSMLKSKKYYYCVQNLVHTKGQLFNNNFYEQTRLGSNIKGSDKFIQTKGKPTFFIDEGDYLFYPCCNIRGKTYKDPNHTLSSSKEKYLSNEKVVGFSSEGEIIELIEEIYIDVDIALYLKKLLK